MSLITVSNLIPNIGDEPHFSDLKLSLRKIGSRLLNLKKASRVPNSSRKYIQGDPVRYIDWRAFARTDQLLLREHRDEASSKVKILLDLRPSLYWPTAADSEDSISKLEIAVRILFHLTYHHLKRGDLVDVIICRDEVGLDCEKIQITSAYDVLLMFRQLNNDFLDFSLKGSAYSLKVNKSVAYDEAYIISDMLNDIDLDTVLGSAKFYRLVHVLSSKEIDLSWIKDDICYFDETSSKIEFHGAYLKRKSDYGHIIDDWLIRVKNKFSKPNRYYLLITDSTPLDVYLTNIFFK